MARATVCGRVNTRPVNKHIADKDLLALVDMEDDVDLAGIGGFSLLGDGDGCLIEAAAVVVGDDRVVVSGQVARRKHLARRGVQQRESAWR